MVIVSIMLAVLVLLMCLGFHLPQGEAQVPAIFKITNVVHTNGYGKMIRESYLVLKNIGKESFPNRYLSVKLYVNGKKVNLNMPTLNSDASCQIPHYGFQNIGGVGTEGNMHKGIGRWYPDQLIWINFNNGTFGPGDIIMIEIYDGLTGKIISRDTYPEPDREYNSGWFYNYFLNHQAA